MSTQQTKPVAAAIWRRMVATLIDVVLVPVFTLFLIMLLDVVEDAEDYASYTMLGVSVLATAIAAYVLLNGYLLVRRGQTVGKWLLGVRIVGTEGMSAPLIRLFIVRPWFYVLLFTLPAVSFMMPVGLIFVVIVVIDNGMALIGERRCVHDMICGTRVVQA